MRTATLNDFAATGSSLKMPGKATAILRGMTWKHDRGLAPLLATARRFSEQHPEVTIKWEARSLQEFGEATVRAFAHHYDLVVIDHPFMGQVARQRCFLPLDENFTPTQLAEVKRDSVGQSYLSYYFAGHQWALPIDAAAQVAGFRPDLLKGNGFKVPHTWDEVLNLAKFRRFPSSGTRGCGEFCRFLNVSRWKHLRPSVNFSGTRDLVAKRSNS